MHRGILPSTLPPGSLCDIMIEWGFPGGTTGFYVGVLWIGHPTLLFGRTDKRYWIYSCDTSMR